MRKIGIVIAIFLLLVLLSEPCFGADTKTAYTRDGINFITKARVEENIKVEYAKPGDYKEVQVPLNTIVIGTYQEDTSNQRTQKSSTQASTKQTTSTFISDFGLTILIVLMFIGALALGGGDVASSGSSSSNYGGFSNYESSSSHESSSNEEKSNYSAKNGARTTSRTEEVWDPLDHMVSYMTFSKDAPPQYKTTICEGDKEYTGYGRTAEEAERRAHEDCKGKGPW